MKAICIICRGTTIDPDTDKTCRHCRGGWVEE